MVLDWSWLVKFLWILPSPSWRNSMKARQKAYWGSIQMGPLVFVHEVNHKSLRIWYVRPKNPGIHQTNPMTCYRVEVTSHKWEACSLDREYWLSQCHSERPAYCVTLYGDSRKEFICMWRWVFASPTGVSPLSWHAFTMRRWRVVCSGQSSKLCLCICGAICSSTLMSYGQSPRTLSIGMGQRILRETSYGRGH